MNEESNSHRFSCRHVYIRITVWSDQGRPNQTEGKSSCGPISFANLSLSTCGILINSCRRALILPWVEVSLVSTAVSSSRDSSSRSMRFALVRCRLFGQFLAYCPICPHSNPAFFFLPGVVWSTRPHFVPSRPPH